MRLKTTISFRGTLPEIIADLELWKKQDPPRAKLLTQRPAALKITYTNYPVKPKHSNVVTGQRELWPEEMTKLAQKIQEQLSE